jgi:hypothetical protein
VLGLSGVENELPLEIVTGFEEICFKERFLFSFVQGVDAPD